MAVEVTSSGVQDAIDAILAVAKRAKDVSPAWADVQDAFVKDEIELFATGGATGKHGTWPPNRASTVTSKGHALVLRGKPADGWNLKASCTVPSHPDHVFVVTPSSVEMGTKDPKARMMADGWGGKGNNPGYPSRRPVDPTDAQVDAYAAIVAKYILEGPE